MTDKNFVETVNDNYEEMKARKNHLGLLIFGGLIMLLACLGIYGLVSLGFNVLGAVPIKVLLTVSLFFNLMFAFLMLDSEE